MINLPKIIKNLKENFISNLQLPAAKTNLSLESFIRGQISALEDLEKEISLAEPQSKADTEIFRL